MFSGAGSIAFEFVSRNAKHVTCVDENLNCINFIKKTASELKINSIDCIRTEVFKFIKNGEFTADIIFADPPFILKETDRLPDLIFKNKLLNENGWLIVEHQSKRILESEIKPFDIRKYGNCAFSMFKI